MTAYKAVLFSPDGEDWVTDCRADTVQEVWERVDNLGSTWFFYPLPFVVRDHGASTRQTQRIVATPDGFEWLQGRTLHTAGRLIAAEREYIAAVLS